MQVFAVCLSLVILGSLCTAGPIDTVQYVIDNEHVAYLYLPILGSRIADILAICFALSVSTFFVLSALIVLCLTVKIFLAGKSTIAS